MPDPEPEQPLPQSELTAVQLLTRLLELIKNSDSVADFSFDQVQRALDVPIERYGPNKWGTQARLTRNWNYAIHALEDFPDGARVMVSFFEDESTTFGDMTEICQLDFDDFTGDLRSAGFMKQSFYGDHGIPLYDAYTRNHLRVEVSSRGEASRSSDKVLHQCIQAVLVR
ncbi:hypothetical protein [Microlunatus sp. Gsoil 973]|jgi:hypothetical protein|uniref:hypothetical protein n=1 Tax=Microlunatus sp. Gsoil 973 TaxID=2672569 RepID=UPI0012B487C4|nr:hypothetical protein [Microlunatus sp. Gsoil 973]QGN34195.1 hypothetical protein GJV80_16745 [Microlunatus sp. Gsoil 973]